MAPLPQPLAHTALAIDEAYVRTARNGDSAGVSVSSVANPCDRALWYAFRWAAELQAATGQRQRIFKSGEIYERRLLDDLRSIGCDVVEVDEATGQQFRIELAGGHLRGKMDGKVTGLPEAPVAEHVAECKSANEKSFKAIVKGPIRETKPEHFAQLQLYLHATGIRRGLYVLANKNTDEIHVERVEYDPVFCLAMVARVERIVALERPPARLHDDPSSKAAFACQFCPARAICHAAQFPRKNCRTCMAATPHDGPRWTCDRHGEVLGYGEMQAGCGDHRFIPDLVPGEQTDADPVGGTITYRMSDGSEWIDGRTS